ECPDPGAMVRAEDIEEAVLADLFELFGNPAAVMAAVAEAVPDKEEREECRRRQGELQGRLAEAKAGRERVVKFIARGVVSEEEEEKELAGWRQRQTSLETELRQLETRLGDEPSPEEARQLAEEIERRKDKANRDLGGMTWEDRRALVELVFAGKAD